MACMVGRDAGVHDHLAVFMQCDLGADRDKFVKDLFPFQDTLRLCFL